MCMCKICDRVKTHFSSHVVSFLLLVYGMFGDGCKLSGSFISNIYTKDQVEV